MSGNVDNAKSGMIENFGVAIEVSFVVAIHAQVSCRPSYADFVSISGRQGVFYSLLPFRLSIIS